MPPDAHTKRRQEDVAKLRILQGEYRNIISITRTQGEPVSLIELELKLETAKNRNFPAEKQSLNKVRIELPVRYPFEPPKVSITSGVWNPNIFPSGVICLGQKWMPAHNLALLVQRVMQILVLDPVIINGASPANRDAAEWYTQQTKHNPQQFPTQRLDSLRVSAQPKISWRPIK